MNDLLEPLDLGDLRRVTPIDSGFGSVAANRSTGTTSRTSCVAMPMTSAGRVLEVADDAYTREFGGARVARSDILHADASNPRATLTGDLAAANELPEATFDCFICTQTLTYIYDVQRAVQTIRHILRPGGVLLATVPGISQMSPYDRDHWGEYWRFTGQSLGRLLGDAFGNDNVEVESYGNVLASTAFLQGMCVEELRRDELDHRDQRYQLLVAGRAVKAA